MRFRAEDRFGASVSAVGALVGDPDFCSNNAKTAVTPCCASVTSSRAAWTRSPGLRGAATFALTSAGDATVRRLDGELIVAVPGIGRMAERWIVPGILKRLDVEAQAIDDQLRPH